MSKVADNDSGVAASLRNTGQQVGGSIGLAVLGTVAWTVVANSIHAQAARAATAAARPATRRAPARQGSPRIYHHALATGFSRAFLVAGRDHAARPGHHPGGDPGAAHRPRRPILNRRAPDPRPGSSLFTSRNA